MLKKSNLREGRHRRELLDRKSRKFEGLRTVWKTLLEEVLKKRGDRLIRVPTTHSVQAMEGLDRLLANPRTHVHEDTHRKAWYVSTLPGCYTCDDHEAEALERGAFEAHIGIWNREDQKCESEAFAAREGEGGNQVKPQKLPV